MLAFAVRNTTQSMFNTMSDSSAGAFVDARSTQEQPAGLEEHRPSRRSFLVRGCCTRQLSTPRQRFESTEVEFLPIAQEWVTWRQILAVPSSPPMEHIHEGHLTLQTRTLACPRVCLAE